MTASCERGDAELVAGLRAGDQHCLASIYDRYADRLYDFCAGMLRDRDDAADAVQDTFLLASSRIGQLRDPQRLRPWLYAIARSVALDRARARSRVRPTDAVTDTADPAAGPERLAEQEGLRRLVADASDGLSEGDRAMLRLHLHGLEGAELGAALGISASTAHVRLSRLRDQVERSLGALLVARLGRRDCDELTAVIGEWDGRFTPLLRKRVARHVDSCPRCGERRGAVTRPWALLSGFVVLPAPAELRKRVLGDGPLVADGQPEPGSADGGPDPGPGPGAEGSAPDPAGRAGPPDLAAPTALPPATAAATPRAVLLSALADRVRSPVARGIAAALVVAALAGGGAAMLWGTRPVALTEAPSVPLAPVTSDPAAAASGPGASTAPDAPSSDPTTAVGAPPTTSALPTTGATARIGPPNATASVPGPGSAVPLGPDPPSVLELLPPTSVTTTNPAPPLPRIVGQNASPPQLGLRGCPVARADVRVTLAADATAAVLSWKGPDGLGVMPMQGSGTTWSGSLGPFRELGQVQWSVTALNAAGSTTGPAETIAVTSCRSRG